MSTDFHGITNGKNYGKPGPLLFGSASTLSQGLTHYWRLDEESGARYDSVGSLVLQDSNTVGFAAGQIGNCAHTIAGNQESLVSTLPISSYRSADGETFSVWVSFPTGQLASYPLAHATAWYFRWIQTGWQAGIFISGAAKTLANTITDADWHNHVIRHDTGAVEGQSMEYWVDGVKQQGRDDCTSLIDESALTLYAIVVGGYTISSNKNMYVDEVGMWNRPLTNDELLELYSSTSPIA